MDKHLKIKDPIFGYITVDDKDLCTIINSAMFQRLRDIVQTSYPSVYPSAVHNRFTHSLGVYHLGNIAQASLVSDAKKQQIAKIDSLEALSKTFLLACLMHDIGHSPFSHTGEHFYFEEEIGDRPKIWKLLLEQLKDTDFYDDLPVNLDPVGAEHEIMSAYVSIVYFSEILNNYDKSFFTRCIIGLKYSDRKDIRNCFIDLLNSKTIDVDKLDYLIRDSYTTGFKSINIDYNRLLEAVCIISKDRNLILGFDKSALSTLESVILAHDMERKWIQNHPVIKYEGNLISYMIAKAQSSFKEKGISLFSPEALSEKGIEVGSEKVCLLSDSDINAFSKKLYGQDSKITEYYAREKRKKPLWKSEAEYKTYFNENVGVTEDVLSLLEERFKSLEKSLIQKFDFPIINQESLSYFKNEIGDSDLPANILDQKKEVMGKAIGLIEILKRFSENNNISFEYVISSASQFKTGFNKEDFKKIKVRFSSDNIYKLDQVLQLFSAKPPRDNFFYLFVNAEDKLKINVSKLTKELIDFILKEFREQSEK